MSEYKPLTPALRLDIEIGFNKMITELKSCEQNNLVVMQIKALEMERRLIRGLPDGFPMPLA